MHSPESAEQDRVVAARDRLLTAGAADLPHRPWQHPNEPPDDVTLLRFALSRASGQVGHASREELAAALVLLEGARADLDALETALLFTARAEGMTWPEIADLLGLRSPQAAQQRLQRVSTRLPGSRDTETQNQTPRDADR